ncbi:hypothetical protein [Caminibacter pacificus]
MIYYVEFEDIVLKESFLMQLEEKLSFQGVIEKIKTHKGCLLFCKEVKTEESSNEEYLYLIRNIKEFFTQLSKSNRLINIFENIQFDYSINDKRYKPSEFIKLNCETSIAVKKIERTILENNLKKVLSFSKKAVIIDPYFSIHYKKSILDLIDKYLGIGLLDNYKFKIEVHLNIKCDGKYFETNLKKWDEYIKSSKNHVEVYIWDDKDSSVKMHDRYLITNNFFINMGKGLEEHNDRYSTFTTWNLNDYDKAALVYRNYRENSSPFKLVHKI